MKRWIHAATYNGFDESEFDYLQRQQIKYGLEHGVDISQYADPRKFDWDQMLEIRKGLEAGLDASQYADPKFDYAQMEEIRLGLEAGLDIRQYADPKFDGKQMEEIREGLKSKVDISQYADPKFDGWQMEKIRKALESGDDISSLMKNSKRSRNWPTKKKWQEGDLDALWETYLSAPEANVNEELEIEVEPSTQAGMGSVSIYDISEEGDGEQIASIDFGDWCEMEIELASSVRSAKKYAEEYRAWIESNIL